MNPFRAVIQGLSLKANAGRSNSDSWAFLLLSILADADDADPVESTYANPYRECLYRLRAYDGVALRDLAHLFGARVNLCSSKNCNESSPCKARRASTR